MNMVPRAAHGDELNPQISSRSDDVCIKLRLQLGRNQILAILCREDAMREISHVGV